MQVRNRRKEAIALVQLGEYSEAMSVFDEVIPSYRHLAAADPRDLRALADLQVVLNDEALGFEAVADPALAAPHRDRRRDLAAAENLLTQTVGIMERMLRQDPSNRNWQLVLADAQVRLANIQSTLHNARAPSALAKTGIAALRDLTHKDQASPMILEQAATAFLKVEPASLRDADLAVSCAERAVGLTHRQTPSMMLTLAQAYRATRQYEKSEATAKEALALMPVAQSESTKPNIRRLLEVQAQLAR
jgi:tetratricopeptide (TPR) repeat protein